MPHVTRQQELRFFTVVAARPNENHGGVVTQVSLDIDMVVMDLKTWLLVLDASATSGQETKFSLAVKSDRQEPSAD
jgi:hypothetical protein